MNAMFCPDDSIETDKTIKALSGAMEYPLKYGYCLVGRVTKAGAKVSADKQVGARVFVFHPHASHCIVEAAGAMVKCVSAATALPI